MQQSTKKQAISHGQMNAGGTPTDNNPSLTIQANHENNEELLERHKIEDSPFYIIGNPKDGYFLSMGKHRLTELLPTIEEVKEHLQNNTWNIILQLVILVCEANDAVKKDEETINDQYKQKKTQIPS